jgi:hypothetical protein
MHKTVDVVLENRPSCLCSGWKIVAVAACSQRSRMACDQVEETTTPSCLSCSSLPQDLDRLLSSHA